MSERLAKKSWKVWVWKSSLKGEFNRIEAFRQRPDDSVADWEQGYVSATLTIDAPKPRKRRQP